MALRTNLLIAVSAASLLVSSVAFAADATAPSTDTTSAPVKTAPAHHKKTTKKTTHKKAAKPAAAPAEETPAQ